MLITSRKFWIMSKRQIRLEISLLITLALLVGCQLSTGVSEFCLIYKPILHSAEDSEITLKQINYNNAVYDDLCTSG